jgi:hypothetical protein
LDDAALKLVLPFFGKQLQQLPWPQRRCALLEQNFRSLRLLMRSFRNPWEELIQIQYKPLKILKQS